MPRVPGLTWLSAGQLDGMNDEVRPLPNIDQTIVSKPDLIIELMKIPIVKNILLFVILRSLLNVDKAIIYKMT